MLELIVLGQVPGTGWQLSFTAILLVLITSWLIIRGLRSFRRYSKFKTHLGHTTARHLASTKKKPTKRRSNSKAIRKATSKRKPAKSKRFLHAKQRLAKA